MRQRHASTSAFARAFVRAAVAANDQPILLAIYGVVPRTPALQRKLEGIVAAISGELAAIVPGPHSALRAQVAIVATLTLIHELVIALPAPRRPAAIREVTAMITAYLR